MSTNPIEAWTGEFGDAYHARQTELHTEATKREVLWRQVLALLPQIPSTILEVGAGMGANLESIDRLCAVFYPHCPYLYALEPNAVAQKALKNYGIDIIPSTAEAIEAADRSFDLVFTYGVLIHMSDPLPAMREMYRVSRRFIMCAEYFSPRREAISYRDGVPLFKDDYGSLWMNNFDLRLLGYGFCWKRATGLDNVTWTLFEKGQT